MIAYAVRALRATCVGCAAVHGSRVRFLEEDVRDARGLCRAVVGMDRIYHLAAQVAVTTSLVNPREDFEINALGHA